MSTIKRPVLRKRNFTGDSGCSLDWQIGFEDNSCAKKCNKNLTTNEDSLNFLGIGDKEKKRRAEVLADIRANYYPSPSSCSSGTEMLPVIQGGVWSANATWTKAPCGSACKYVEQKIPHLRLDIQEAQRKIDSGESKDVAPRYLEAFNTILGEYIDFYNKNCVDGTAALGNTPVAPNSVNEDPLLQTASPAGSGGYTPGIAPAPAPGPDQPLPSGASIKTTTSNGTSNMSQGAGSSSGSDNKSTSPNKKFIIPTWAYWVAGGLVVATAITVIALNHKKKPEA